MCVCVCVCVCVRVCVCLCVFVCENVVCAYDTSHVYLSMWSMCRRASLCVRWQHSYDYVSTCVDL